MSARKIFGLQLRIRVQSCAARPQIALTAIQLRAVILPLDVG
jgi:hypothetical protein